MATAKSPVSRVYTNLEPPPSNDIGVIVDDVGLGFIIGSVGGSLYHFLKGFKRGGFVADPVKSKFSAGINVARANALRTGGFVALFSLVTHFSYAIVSEVRDKKADLWTEIPSLAAVGALMWAPRGLRPASRAAIVLGALPAALTLGESWLYNLPKHSNATYTYPHYRLRNPQPQPDQN